MAEAEVKYGSKKQAVQDLFDQTPHLKNSAIAKLTGSSEGYVYRLLGPNRTSSQVAKTRLDKSKGLKGVIWTDFKKTRNDFVEAFLPLKEYKSETDFAGYHLPTEDSFASAGTGEDLSGSWSQYEFLSEQRIGIGPRITRMPAEDAVINGFKFLDRNTGEEVKKPKVQQWVEDTDFLNELAQALYFERMYGVGFLLMYYSEDDKAKGLLGKEVKKSEGIIKAFEAHPPTILSPVNIYESDKLDKNPQNWDLMGGEYNPQRIDHTRVRVIMTRHKPNRWYGLSIWEPIWDSAIPYYQALIFLLRGFVRWGNTLATYIINSEEDIETLYNKHGTLIEEMAMNGVLIAPMGSEVGFTPTQLATGLREMMDIWIEDICAGTAIPVPLLMGRVVASGLGNNGYAIMERYYWNMIQKIQRSITDDVLAILKQASFKLDGLKLDWNISLTKTDEQRLADELMEREITLADLEIETVKLSQDRMKIENEQMELQLYNEALGEPTDANDLQTTTQQTKDFLEVIRAKRQDLKMRRLQRLEKIKQDYLESLELKEREGK